MQVESNLILHKQKVTHAAVTLMGSRFANAPVNKLQTAVQLSLTSLLHSSTKICEKFRGVGGHRPSSRAATMVS